MLSLIDRRWRFWSREHAPSRQIVAPTHLAVNALDQETLDRGNLPPVPKRSLALD